MTRAEKKEELIGLFSTGAIFIGDLIDECFEFGQQHPQWIRVKDELPEACVTVLTTTQHGTQSVGCYEDGWWLANSPNLVRMGSITHWMPLPAIEGIKGNQRKISPNEKGDNEC